MAEAASGKKSYDAAVDSDADGGESDNEVGGEMEYTNCGNGETNGWQSTTIASLDKKFPAPGAYDEVDISRDPIMCCRAPWFQRDAVTVQDCRAEYVQEGDWLPGNISLAAKSK